MKKKYVACIALIDDDPDTLELMAAFFRNFDFQTILYSDANLAFEDITNAKISCDVIVTDLNMPNLSGIEFTKKMKEIESNIPIIVVTAIRKVETAVEAIHVGAYDFLVKPLHLAQLLVSVQRALYLVNLQQDNETLKSVVNIQQGPANVNGIIGKSPSIRLALDLARRVSAYSTNVLISGESGTGKEVIARAIHNLGPRKNLPFTLAGPC